MVHTISVGHYQLTRAKMSSEFSEILLPRIRLFVRLCVNVSYFRLLLQNHQTNINQTWLKAASDKGDSSFFKIQGREHSERYCGFIKTSWWLNFRAFCGQPSPTLQGHNGILYIGINYKKNLLKISFAKTICLKRLKLV